MSFGDPVTPFPTTGIRTFPVEEDDHDLRRRRTGRTVGANVTGTDTEAPGWSVVPATGRLAS